MRHATYCTNLIPECFNRVYIQNEMSSPNALIGDLLKDINMQSFTRISVQKAHELIKSSDVTIVDIRDANSYAKGHIERAKDLNDENIDVFLNEADKEKPLICYCYHGNSSQRAAAFLVSQGFKEVYSVDGGYEEWRSIYA